jgi:hypothetical protein
VVDRRKTDGLAHFRYFCPGLLKVRMLDFQSGNRSSSLRRGTGSCLVGYARKVGSNPTKDQVTLVICTNL